MLSCFPDLDNGDAQKKNNMKRFSYICFKKTVILNLVHFPCQISSLFSQLSHTQKKIMGKKIGIKVTNGQIHILQRLLSGKSPGPMLRQASTHD